MSVVIIVFLGAIALEIPLARAIERQARREKEERAGILAGEMARKALQEAETARMEGEAREIVRVAHLALEEQKAAGYGPWLTCLLRRAGDPGRRVTPGIALQAVRMCISDLAGSRFNLQCLYDAQAALEEITGAGE